MLLGGAAMDKLRCSHVAVIGLGGVGSYAAEALARSGIGELTLCDYDTVSNTNLNRQLGALHSTLGRSKAEVLTERAIDINPDIRAHSLRLRYEADSRESFFSGGYDYIIDAIDLVSCKLDLIQTALSRCIPIVSSMGTGNRTDPSKLRIGDIRASQGDPLARVIRKELRRRDIIHHTVLWSTEPPRKPIPLEEPPPGRRSQPASLAWVPSCAGLMLAGYVITTLTGSGNY